MSRALDVVHNFTAQKNTYGGTVQKSEVLVGHFVSHGILVIHIGL